MKVDFKSEVGDSQNVLILTKVRAALMLRRCHTCTVVFVSRAPFSPSTTKLGRMKDFPNTYEPNIFFKKSSLYGQRNLSKDKTSGPYLFLGKVKHYREVA